MKSLQMRSFLLGIIITVSVFLLIGAKTTGVRIDVTEELQEELKPAFKHCFNKRSYDKIYRKHSIETFDIYFSEERPRDPMVIIINRDRPSPWVVLRERSITIEDNTGCIISASSHYNSLGKVDLFSYSSQSKDERTYYSDHNLDGSLDIVTTHYLQTQPFRRPDTRVCIDGDWFDLTHESYFEGEWLLEEDGLIKGKKRTENYRQTNTSDGVRIVRIKNGIPEFVESVAENQ